MEFDDMQRAWQSQQLAAPVVIRSDLLLKEVRRNQRHLWATIFWRDVREVGAAVLLVLWFTYASWKHHHWPDYLSAVACGGVGAFILIDRLRQKKTQPRFDGSLRSCLEASLAQVNHQIWLLKNVFWWYLLPLLVTGIISMLYTHFHLRHPGFGSNLGEIITTLLIAWFFRFVYRLNQAAVHKTLEPRRHELEELRDSLK